MALIQKTLFPENLDRYNVFVEDTTPNSRYFNITELPDTFTGGKNAFLIAGASELVADTLIKIEIKDAAGNIIYHEPGEGSMITTINGEQFTNEYYEGISKVVSVYVYPGDTAYGPCTITILGELSSYYDNNGLVSPIPLNWEGQYNVKWQKTINVNPTLANTTKIRFYRRPSVSINELISPVYRIESGLKINTGINQSFANIKLSNLETFAGDVKRIKVFRTSLGDISDYDMIQDILVESKELLTSYDLSGSVVGNTGTLTSETFKSYWNTGSLNATLDSTRVEAGVKLKGAGNFTYTASLDLKSTNTYELNLDAFYSASTPSNLGIYILSGSTSSSIGTLNGISPTKNLLDTTIPFKLDKEFSPATLYFSQSQGEWNLGNISLRLSEDTAFSPDEVSFVTTMPTVVGNEDYNFKFEFYDVNNNYVPVMVTGSANFTGGSNAITKLLTFESDRTAFRFSTGSYANPPNQNVKFKTIKTNFTGSITYASSAFDVGGTYITPASYAGTYPGWFTSQNDNGALLSIASFSGSVSSVLVGSIVYTASCEGFEEYETIYRFEDGDNAPGVFVTANTNQFIYKATDLSINPAGQVITLEAKRKNLASATTPLTVNSGSGKPPLTLVSTNATNGVDIYTLAGSTFPFGTGESIYFISGSDQFGNEFSDAIKITPVKILDGLSVTLTNDNASLPALSNGFVASGSFLLTSGSVTVKVGNESISFDDDNDSVRANNTFAITDVTGTGCTPNTGNNSNPSTNQYGITNLTSDSGSLNITISYKDGAGDTTSIVKTATYTKNKKAAPVLRLEATPKDQSVSAKSTGEQVDSFSNVTISVKETYNGATSTLTITSLTATSSDISSISANAGSGLVTLSGKTLANGTNATTIAISAVVTDAEGVSRTLTDTLSLSKVKKATPNVEGQISPTAQTVTANSDGTNPATPTSLTVKALEGGTTRLTSVSAVGVGVTIGTITYNGSSPFNFATIPLSSVSADTATITVTINYTDSEGNTGSKTAIATISKAKKASPVVVISANPQSQTVAATSAGVYSAPATIAISVNEGGTAYTYAASGNNTFQVTGITGGTNASGVITPTTPTSAAGTSGVATISYINSEGTTVTGKTINFSVGVATQGSNGADGGAGPGVVYRGVWANGVEYYKTTTRVDVVSYLGAYYLATLTHTSATGNATTGQPGVGTRWTAFGAQFSSVATDVLLAQDATITRGLVMGTLGSDSGFIRSANATSLTDGTGFYLNVDGKVRFGNPSGGRVYWDGTTLSITGTINANAGTFSGDISSTATISGGTISGGTISGGTISIGSSNSIFKADANGIYLGNATFASAPFRVSMAGALTATSATITGVINATSGNFSGDITSTATITGGTISGGAINGGSINIGGGNFTVNAAGSLTAVNATLSGSVNATSGKIGNWVIDGTILRDENSGIKLDPVARSINILNSGVVKTTLNGNTVLSNPFAADIYLGDLPNITGQINTSFSISSNTTSTDSTFYTSYSSNFSVGQAGPVKLTMSTGNIAVGGSIPYGYAYCGGASGGGISVTGDTLITMYNGSHKLAKDIVANDLIKSWDWRNNKNQIIKTPVTDISKRTINKIYVVTIGDLVLKVSDSHGFWLDNNEEIKVNDLIPNQTEIYVIDGDTIIKKIVDNVEIIYENVDVFTLHIDETNNYISNGIVSHNPAPGYGGTADYSGIRGYGYLQIYAEFYNNTNGQSVLAYLGGANKYGSYSYCDAGVTQYQNGYDAPKAASYGEVATFTIPSIGSYKWRYKIVVGVRPAESANYYGEYTPENTTFTATVGNLQNWNHSTSPGILNLPTNIVEVTNAGIQVLNDATTYLKMPRFDSSTSWAVEPLIQTRGGYGAYFEGKYDTTYGYSRCLYLAGQVYLSDSLGSGFESNIFPRYNSGQSCGQSDKKWSTVYATSPAINTSDRNQKKEIEESDLGINLINKLKPVKYKFIENTSNRFHYGLIAQDVSGSLNELGVETKDFAGYIEMNMYASGSNKISNLSSLKEENDISEWMPVKEYGLRYEEFISPMIKAIQQLSAKVDELEARISGSI